MGRTYREPIFVMAQCSGCGQHLHAKRPTESAALAALAKKQAAHRCEWPGARFIDPLAVSDEK